VNETNEAGVPIFHRLESYYILNHTGTDFSLFRELKNAQSFGLNYFIKSLIL